MNPTPPYDEGALLAQIAGGDEKAFRHLMDLYANPLGAYLYRITHSKERTEELVQDIFLKIWMTRESLVEVRNFRTFLYVVSRNQAISALRSLIQERNRQKQLKAEGFPTAVDPHEDDLRKEQLSLLDMAIAQLPPQQQKAWILSRQERLKYHEIAREMNLSPETVKKYIKLASLSITNYMETHIGILLLGIFLKNF